jgi:hypothetical protein
MITLTKVFERVKKSPKKVLKSTTKIKSDLPNICYGYIEMLSNTFLAFSYF